MATINHNQGYKGYFRVFSWDQLATIRVLKSWWFERCVRSPPISWHRLLWWSKFGICLSNGLPNWCKPFLPSSNQKWQWKPWKILEINISMGNSSINGELCSPTQQSFGGEHLICHVGFGTCNALAFVCYICQDRLHFVAEQTIHWASGNDKLSQNLTICIYTYIHIYIYTNQYHTKIRINY